MAAKQKLRTVILPEPGEAFLMPLPDGRFGVCRAIRRPSADQDERFLAASDSVLVVASTWIGDKPPDVRDPSLRMSVALTHHNHNGGLAALWISDSVPETFRRLGRIEPRESEKSMRCLSFGGWEWFPFQVHTQWRWEHEREAVLREDAITKEAQAAEQGRAVEERRRYLASLTLEKLRIKRRFDWKGHVPDKVIRACRQVFRRAIDALVRLRPKKTSRERLRVLKQCILELNELDAEHGHFITTIEREDLCEEFDEIVHAAGLRRYHDLADRWREW